jgi:hypothetical protein
LVVCADAVATAKTRRAMKRKWDEMQLNDFIEWRGRRL